MDKVNYRFLLMMLGNDLHSMSLTR